MYYSILYSYLSDVLDTHKDKNNSESNDKKEERKLKMLFQNKEIRYVLLAFILLIIALFLQMLSINCKALDTISFVLMIIAILCLVHSFNIPKSQKEIDKTFENSKIRLTALSEIISRHGIKYQDIPLLIDNYKVLKNKSDFFYKDKGDEKENIFKVCVFIPAVTIIIQKFIEFIVLGENGFNLWNATSIIVILLSSTLLIKLTAPLLSLIRDFLNPEKNQIQKLIDDLEELYTFRNLIIGEDK